jgi:hypothetical protein
MTLNRPGLTGGSPHRWKPAAVEARSGGSSHRWRSHRWKPSSRAATILARPTGKASFAGGHGGTIGPQPEIAVSQSRSALTVFISANSSLGCFRRCLRDLGALPANRRHTGDGRRIRDVGSADRRQGWRSLCNREFRSLLRE